MEYEQVIDMTGRAGPLAGVPRVWWFPGLRGYRGASGVTYGRYALDDQPPVPSQDDLSWLEGEDAKPQWSIAEGDPVQPLTPAGLKAITAGLPVTVPASLRLLAARPDLQRRIRSATACFLDLGDFPAASSDGGSYLIHVLSDQQWCLHWLLYLDLLGRQAVVATTEPVGMDLGEESSPPLNIPADHDALGLTVCADTFAEFLYRFWIENEIFFALHGNQPLAPAAAAYAARLASGQ